MDASTSHSVYYIIMLGLISHDRIFTFQKLEIRKALETKRSEVIYQQERWLTRQYPKLELEQLTIASELDLM